MNILNSAGPYSNSSAHSEIMNTVSHNTFLFVNCLNQDETNYWWSSQSRHDMPQCSEEIEYGVPPKPTLNSASLWVMAIWISGCHLSFSLMLVTRSEDSMWSSWVTLVCQEYTVYANTNFDLDTSSISQNHNCILLKFSCDIIDDFWSLYTIIEVCYTSCCLVYLTWLELHILHLFLQSAVWASCTRFEHLVPFSMTPS